MKLSVRRVFLFLVFALLVNLEGFTQNPCNPGEAYCRGECRSPKECGIGGPPPPGLIVPIDSNIYFLLIAGVGLGIYFHQSYKKKITA